MTTYAFAAGGLIITCALILNACDDIIKPDDSLEKIVFPETLISYNRHVQPVFNIACATSECHDVNTKASNLDLSDYLGIKQRFYDVVIVRDTAASRLIWYITGRSGSDQWHRPLNPNQVRGFKQWIMEGATDTIP